MSHHYSGPNIGFPRGDARLDLTDLFAFPKPGDPGKSIFIINVHPSVGLNPRPSGAQLRSSRTASSLCILTIFSRSMESLRLEGAFH
jgi:hypothetical protein